MSVPSAHSSAQTAETTKSAPHEEALRPFTVADSIESTHFVEPAEHSGEHPAVSPDGARFFVVTEHGLLQSNLVEYALIVFEFDHLSNGPRRIATFRSSSNRPGIWGAKWISNESIAFLGENPNELTQVYVVNCKTRKIRKLTTAPTGVYAYDVTSDLKTVAYYAAWTPSREEIKAKEDHGFAVSDEWLNEIVAGRWEHPMMVYQMFIFNPGVGKPRPIKATPINENNHRIQITLSPDGRYAVVCEPPVSIPNNWELYDSLHVKAVVGQEAARVRRIRDGSLDQAMLVDMQTAEIRSLLAAPLLAPMNAVWLDSRSVLVSGTALPLNTADPEELARRKKNESLVEVAVPDLSFRRIIDQPEDEYWVALRRGDTPDTFAIEGSKIEQGGASKPFPTRWYQKHEQQWTELKTGHVADRGLQIVIAEANDRWPRLVRVDPMSKAETVFLDPNPQFKNFQFGREEILRWTGNLGEPLVAGLLYPPRYTPGKKYPLVIQTYGLFENGFLLDGPAVTAFAAQALVNHDLLVLQLPIGPLYHQTLFTPDFGKTEMSQIESAVKRLDEMGLVDVNRVGLVGFSMKGYQVTYAVTHSKYRFAAATSAEGNDWSYWHEVLGGNSPGWIKQNEAPYGGPPWSGNWKTWMQGSITFNFDKIHTPLRLESDTGEYAEVLQEWEKFVALKRLQRPVELICLLHGWHPIVRPWDRMTSQQGNVDWMVFWLKDEEDSDPAKAEQYARWRELRKLQSSDMTSKGAPEPEPEPEKPFEGPN